MFVAYSHWDPIKRKEVKYVKSICMLYKNGDSLAMSVEDIDGAISLIKEWIEQRGISKGTKIEPTSEEFYFQFTGEDEAEIPFTIFQPKSWRRTILILSQVDLSKEHIKSLESMRPKDRDDFLCDLRKDIAFASASVAFDPALDETGILKGIQFQEEICYDGLTEDRLNNAVKSVIRGSLFIIWRIRREFGEVEGEE